MNEYRRRRLDRILDPDFVAGLAGLSLDELRARRQDAMAEEDELSYVRRLLQGHLELADRRRSDLSVSADSDEALVASVTAALVNNITSPGASSRHSVVTPVGPRRGRRKVERVLAEIVLPDREASSGDQLDERVAWLREQERLVSDQRQHVHDVLRVLTDELAARYRGSAVSD